MSCFESSRFRRDFRTVTPRIMKLTCEKLGWQFIEIGVSRYVLTDNASFFEVEQGTIRYNSEIQEDAVELFTQVVNDVVAAQRKKFLDLQIEYARRAVITHFEEKGFYYQSDNSFRPTSTEIDRFYMCAYTQLREEDSEDRKTSILFTIMRDGSVVSDSNYIPEDVHEAADEAMEALEVSMGHKRREGVEIKRKVIPEKYKFKSYCSIHNKGANVMTLA
jgi:hypothetical protein